MCHANPALMHWRSRRDICSATERLAPRPHYATRSPDSTFTVPRAPASVPHVSRRPQNILSQGVTLIGLHWNFCFFPFFDMSPRTTRVGDRLPSSMRQSQPNHSDTGGSADSTRSSPSIFPGHCSRLSKSISLSTTRCQNRTDAKQSPASTAHAPACAAFRGRGGAPIANSPPRASRGR